MINAWRPSAHFSAGEFACKDSDKTPYPVKWHDRGERLARILEDLRAHLGGAPLRLGSVYRTSTWNRKQGGSPRSQHPQGRAADPHPPKLHGRRMPIAQFHDLCKEFAEASYDVGGIGYYTWGCHIDIRERKSGRLATWNKVISGTKLHDIAT